MSARSRTVLPGRAPRRRPTTPVLAMPVRVSIPRLAQPLGDEAGGVLLLEAEFGVLVQIAAVGDDLRADLPGGVHDRQLRNQDLPPVSLPALAGPLLASIGGF